MYKIQTESKGLLCHGVSTCAGCAMELIFRKVLEVLGADTIIVIPPGCAALFSGFGKETTLKIPGFQGNLENSAAIASGIRSGLEVQGKKDINVVVFAGDGATVDIGLQSLSGMIERGDKVLYICYDNEAYMNTGGQSSGSTPLLAKTTTTPQGKTMARKNILDIVSAHNIPYCASASVCEPADLKRKVKKAKETDGPSFIHIHSPCPTGWGYDTSKTIEVAKMAIDCGYWSLIEVENGERMEYKKKREKNAPDSYFKMQKRFNSK